MLTMAESLPAEKTAFGSLVDADTEKDSVNSTNTSLLMGMLMHLCVGGEEPEGKVTGRLVAV